jgi:hypothetical protein
MKKFMWAVGVVAVLTTFAAASALALQTSKISFSASYAGTAVTKVTGDKIDYQASGKGSGTLVKASKIQGVGVGDKSNPPCAPFNGPGSITSSAGKLKLSVLPSSRACAADESDQNNISLSGTAKVLGGTLKFKKARGSLHFSGHFTRSTGKFTVKLRGPLTY